MCCFGERSVHPRLRGELAVNSGYLTSNPRFIPACAGNSGVRSVHKSFVPVHPRLRGELCTEPKLLTIAFGSSPLARGTLHNRLSVFVYPRFIPACAGNSVARPSWKFKPSVHPRLRGELVVVGTSTAQIAGSSPLARGTLSDPLEYAASERFIPACAGNSRIQPEQLLADTVHPRLRGELCS